MESVNFVRLLFWLHPFTTRYTRVYFEVNSIMSKEILIIILWQKETDRAAQAVA